MTTRKHDAGKKVDFRKLKKLCKAAQSLVDARSDEIALLLLKGTSNGATLSKRLLFELAEAGVDIEALGLGPVVSLAERLRQEPQVAAARDEDAGDGDTDD